MLSVPSSPPHHYSALFFVRLPARAIAVLVWPLHHAHADAEPGTPAAAQEQGWNPGLPLSPLCGLGPMIIDFAGRANMTADGTTGSSAAAVAHPREAQTAADLSGAR